jgi:hypothetical protein
MLLSTAGGASGSLFTEVARVTVTIGPGGVYGLPAVRS